MNNKQQLGLIVDLGQGLSNFISWNGGVVTPTGYFFAFGGRKNRALAFEQ